MTDDGALPLELSSNLFPFQPLRLLSLLEELDIMAEHKIYRASTTAPVNIAVIKSVVSVTIPKTRHVLADAKLRTI